MAELQYAPSGRQPLGITLDEDWNAVLRGVRGLPELCREDGIEEAITAVQGALSAKIAAIDLAPVETERQAKLRQATLNYLSEGSIRVMCRADALGALRRRKFIRAMERTMLDRTLKWVFAHTPPLIPKGYGREPSD